MSDINNVYHCKYCNKTVEVVGVGDGSLVCCGQVMEYVKPNTTDGTTEKHIPVITPLEDGGIRVTVGSIEHPMTEAHHIEWIEVINGSYVNRKYLKVGDLPMAEFYVDNSSKLEVREYCNLHGLWKR